MGTFGTVIASDDTVADIVGFISDRLKHGADVKHATQEALKRFRELERDPDEGPLLFLALAHAQWKYGAVEPSVLLRVQADVSKGRGLERWKEDPRLLREREKALAAFLAKVSSPNPKPSAAPRLVKRHAPFSPGDCLAVRTRDSRYTAALVLATNDSNVELGMNLVGGLDYLNESPPSTEVFERRPWLFKHHGNWNGEPDLAWYLPVRFRKERERFTVVGRVALRGSDPRSTAVHATWSSLGTQVLHSGSGSRGVVV
jgi:hypothetical protein